MRRQIFCRVWASLSIDLRKSDVSLLLLKLLAAVLNPVFVLGAEG